MKLFARAAMLCLAVAGCASTNPASTDGTYYSPPWQSGLKTVRPYPSAGSPCYEIARNMVSKDFWDDANMLIGCPKYDQAAIDQQVAGGARVVGYIHHWTMLNVPAYR